MLSNRETRWIFDFKSTHHETKPDQSLLLLVERETLSAWHVDQRSVDTPEKITILNINTRYFIIYIRIETNHCLSVCKKSS